MKHSFLRFFSKDKSYSIIILSSFVLLFLTAVISPRVILYYEKNWIEYSDSKVISIADEITNEFTQRELKLISSTNSAAEEVSQILSDSSRVDELREELFNILKQASLKGDYTFQLYKNELEPIAWTNQYFEFQLPAAFFESDSVVFIYKENFKTSISYIRRISDRNLSKYFVAGFDDIEMNYGLRNEFISTETLEEELTAKYKTRVRTDFSDDASESLDGRIFSKRLTHFNGDYAGYLYINRPSQLAFLSELKEVFSKIQQLLFLVLLGVIFYSFIKDFTHIKSKLVQSAIATIFIWLIRVVIFYFQFPSEFVESDLFNPIYFASRFGFGMVKSPGELFLTASAILINVSFLFLLLRRWMIETNFAKTSSLIRILFTILALMCIVLFPFLLRGYGASSRSFVFDSSLKYFESASILPNVPFFLMHINVFIASISIVFASLIILLLVLKAFELWMPRSNQSRLIFFTALLLFFSGLIFIFIDTSDQYSILYLILFVLAIGLFIKFLSDLPVFINFSLVIAVLVISSLSTVFMLFEKNELQEKELQRTMTFELTKPQDQLLNFVLNETLTNLSNNPDLVYALRQKSTTPNFDLVSYKLWINSLLSSEGINSVLTLINPYGRVLGNFGVGLNETDYFQRYFDPRLISQLTIFVNRNQYPGKIFGVIPVRDENKTFGFAAITLDISANKYDNQTTPKIFKSVQSERDPLQLLPEAVIYSFAKTELMRLKGEDVPEKRQLPEEIANLSLQNSYQEIWKSEKFGNKNYSTFYFLYEQNGLPKILAISSEKKSFSWYIYNFFRLIFIHFLISITVLAIISCFLIIKGYKFKIRFKTKLFAGLLLVTIIPLFILAYYNRENALENWNQSIRNELRKDLDVIEVYLRENSKDTFLSSQAGYETLNKSAQKLQLDFNIYINDKLQFTTQKKLYDLNFFQSGLDASVYDDLFLNDKLYSYNFENIGNYKYLVGYKKVSLNEGRNVLISSPTIYKQEKIQKEIAQIDAFIFGTYSFTLILIFIFGSFILERISKPITDLTEATKKVSQGDLKIQLNTNETGEVGDLIDAFNKMISDLEESQKNLAQAEREYAWKEMAKQVAHEIKNPLTPMKLSLQHLQVLYKENKKEFAKIFGKVSATLVEQIEALNQITNEFSHFARMPKRNIQRCDLVQIIQEAVSLFASHMQIKFNFVSGEKYFVSGDKEELKRILINLFKNSIQADATEISVDLFSDAKFNFINVLDNGAGIPKESLDKLFEPNFSTKSEGMGLGLSIIKKIITEMDGAIEVESEEEKYTLIKISLPKDISTLEEKNLK